MQYSGAASWDVAPPLEHEPAAVPTELQDWASVLDVPFWDSLAERAPSAEYIARIPISFARKHAALGLASSDDRLIVVLGSFDGWPCLDTLRRFFRRGVTPAFAPPDIVRSAINVAYEQRSGQTQKLLDTLESAGDLVEELKALPARQDLLDTSDRAPVIRLVNTILFEAVTGLASDVHVQPYEESVVVRLRIDGILFDAYTIPKHLQDELTSRIKVIGRMDIAERRLPQDGRATVEVGDRLVDLRIASLPTSHGERIVVRLLDKSARLYTLSDLGFTTDTLYRFRRLVRQEHGMFAGDRSHRQREEHDVVRRVAGDQLSRAERRHIGRPYRISVGRDQPDAGECQLGLDLRQRPAERLAAGSGHHRGGRDPRRGDRRDVDSVSAHRTPRAVHVACQ